MNEEKILKELSDHGGKLERLIAASTEHDQKIDKIVTIAVDHGERLTRIEQTMATKDDMRHMLGILEDIATRIKRIEEDHTFAIEWLKRLQTQMEKQEHEIQLIKMKLSMA